MPRDAVVIGSGPNGLSAGIILARAGLRVKLFEASEHIGGGVRSAALTLPGFVHDCCSAVHPLAVCSPCFEQFPLATHGLEWIHPDAPLAHPLDDGTAVMLERSVVATAKGLGEDGTAWRRLFEPLALVWPMLRHSVLASIRFPSHPWEMARFGMLALAPARRFAERMFRGTRARALFAGLAAHSILPLETTASAAIGLVLGVTGMTSGWPIPKGGAQRIADALAAHFRELGGEMEAGRRVDSLPEASAVLCDTSPRELLRLAGDRMPAGFRRSLLGFRHGPGVFKLDWALDAPIPWTAKECARAGTVHIGGTLEEIAESERTLSGPPFVLLAQPSLFDATRAPAGKHTAWAYCHVPNGSTEDRTEAIEAQVERFAPGFRTRILARHVYTPASLEQLNANLIGGDITGGANTLLQVIFRPTWRLYRTPLRGVYLCSSSTPPGGGVHGMCGYHAARCALEDMRGRFGQFQAG